MLARPEFNFKKNCNCKCNAIHQFKLNWPCNELHLKAIKVADCSSKRKNKTILSAGKTCMTSGGAQICVNEVSTPAVTWRGHVRAAAQGMGKKNNNKKHWCETNWKINEAERGDNVPKQQQSEAGWVGTRAVKQSCRRTTAKERVANTRWLAVSSHCECFGGLGWRYFTSITVQFILLKLFFGRDTKERVRLLIWQRQRAEIVGNTVCDCEVMHSPKVLWHTKSHNVRRIDPSRLKDHFQLRLVWASSISKLPSPAEQKLFLFSSSSFFFLSFLLSHHIFFSHLDDVGHLSDEHQKTQTSNTTSTAKTSNERGKTSRKKRGKKIPGGIICDSWWGKKKSPAASSYIWNVLDETPPKMEEIPLCLFTYLLIYLFYSRHVGHKLTVF